MTTDTASFAFDRHYALSAARLWHVLTDAKMRERWGGPSDDTVLEVERTDLTENGFERHRCGPKEAPEFIVDTRWYRLAAPELAVFTETLEIGGEKLATSLVTYRLSPTETGTALAIRVAVSSFAGPDVPAEFSGGWEGGLANLDRLITEVTEAAAS